MDLSVIKQSGSINERRDYRKGNWTFQETMVLLEAKKMDDERRLRRLGDGGERGKPAELRWKWVEDYCWRNGCFRSQNQCNDKWDNLMRDFKKVREYEGRIAVAARGGDGGQVKSYWKMEKNERKEKNLPSNMVPQIYEALVEVAERKGQRAAVAGSGGAGSSGANVPETSTSGLRQQYSILPSPLQQIPIIQALAMVARLPPPVRTEAEPPTLPFSQPLPTVDSDTSEYSGSPAKRRKRRDGEGTSGTAGGTSTRLEREEVGSAISKSASMIAETIQKCEERGERRHREMVNLHERRLRIEESKAEINRQGINGLVDAINKLSNSILALATNKNQPPSS